MYPTINVHCHILNFQFVQDSMIRILSKIPERLADQDWFAAVAGYLTATMPGRDYDRLKEMLKIYGMPIDQVARRYLNSEMKEAGIDVCTPLLMDVETCFQRPDLRGNVPYPDQIDLISAEAARYPWRIFPFVMFDPRRPGGFEMVRLALEAKGYLGVKLYPALGYHPLVPRGAKDKAAQELRRLYEYCGQRQIPLTVHCSTGGAYATPTERRERDIWPHTEASNWMPLLQEFGLCVNFAHFGGDDWNENEASRVQSCSWKRTIQNLMRFCRSTGRGRVYADLSFHDMALRDSTRKAYFEELNRILAQPECAEAVLFGTDASMITHTWTEAEFIAPFRRHIKGEDARRRVFYSNPRTFLFGPAGRIPDTYVRFLRKQNPTAFTQLPWFIREEGKAYYLEEKVGTGETRER